MWQIFQGKIQDAVKNLHVADFLQEKSGCSRFVMEKSVCGRFLTGKIWMWQIF